MKVSNETKVGALTAIAIVFMVLGYNFLRGRTLFKTGNFLYAKYSDVKGLMVSNGVYANGFRIGNIYEIENESKDLRSIIVGIKLKDNYDIPANSTATIVDNPLGSPQIDIHLGDSKTLLKSGDFILSENSKGLLGALTSQLTPVADNLKSTLHTLDSALKNLNSIFDPRSKSNIQSAIGNINTITGELAKSSASLTYMLDKQNGSVAQTMNSVNSFSKNLASQNEKISETLDNVKTTTQNLSQTDLKGAVDNLKTTITSLNTVVNKMNSKDGSLGLLMNDKQLYNNLNNTIRSANILVDDLRANPKRYVNFSVFGKKDKGNYLKSPLIDNQTQP